MSKVGDMHHPSEMESPACGDHICSVCGRSCQEAYYGTAMSDDHVLCLSCAQEYWGDIPFDHLRVDAQ